MVPIFPLNTRRPATRRHPPLPGPILPLARLLSFCTCTIWKSAGIAPAMISFIGLSGISRARQPDFRKASPWELSYKTAPTKSAPAARCIAVRARLPMARGIITPLNFLRWTRRSMSSLAPTDSKLARTNEGDPGTHTRQGRLHGSLSPSAIVIGLSRRNKHIVDFAGVHLCPEDIFLRHRL